MELVTRQCERSGHQQRLLQSFAEDVFIFSLLVYIAHESFVDDALYKFTFLLIYLFCRIAWSYNSTQKRYWWPEFNRVGPVQRNFCVQM